MEPQAGASRSPARVISTFSRSGHRHDVGSRRALSAGYSGAGQLGHAMIHEEATSLHAWFDRHNRYSDWEAALLADKRHEQLSRRERGFRRLLKRIFAGLP